MAHSDGLEWVADAELAAWHASMKHLQKQKGLPDNAAMKISTYLGRMMAIIKDGV